MEKKKPDRALNQYIPWTIGLVIVGIYCSLIFSGYPIDKSVSFALFGLVAFSVIFFVGRWLMTRPISTKLQNTRWGRMDLGTKLVMFALAVILLLVGFGGTFTLQAPGIGLVLLFVLLYWLLMARKK